MLKPIHVQWNKSTVSAWSPHHENGQIYMTFDDTTTYLKGLWDLHTMSEKRFDNREFLIQGDRRITFREFFDQVKLCAIGLEQELKIKPLDRVVMLAKNCIEWIIVFVASTWIGAIAVPMNSWWTSPEIKYGLDDCGASVVFADEERLKRIQAIPGGVGSCKVMETIPTSFMAFLNRQINIASKFPPLSSRPPSLPVDEPAMIMYTSGTTNHPKGCVLTHRSVCHVLNTYEFGMKAGESSSPPRPPVVASSTKPSTAATAAGSRATESPPSVILLAVPLFHATGMFGILLSSLILGRKIVMMDKWNPEIALAIIERERVTAFTGVPTMVLSMLASPDLPKRNISSLKNVGGGGAPIPQGTAQQIKQKFKASPGQGYGLTETSSLATSNTGSSYLAKPGSCGRAIPGVQIEIWGDEDEKPLPIGMMGRIMIRGANLFREYWKQPEATAKAITKTGWFDSGDLGSLDNDGYLYIQDRAKDMIIRGGENISCRSVEEAVYAHVPGILECSVIGIPHDLLGEEVCLALVMKDNKSIPSVEEIQHALKNSLAQYQLPVALVTFNKQLPRGATGKIVKRDIRKLIGDGKIKLERFMNHTNNMSNNKQSKL
jgi:long-chain acyl-CoA synthetase